MRYWLTTRRYLTSDTNTHTHTPLAASLCSHHHLVRRSRGNGLKSTLMMNFWLSRTAGVVKLLLAELLLACWKWILRFLE